jgi:ribosome biogenesis GTPase / thiamine phosphate phosphatase
MQVFENQPVLSSLGWTPFFHQQYLRTIFSEPELASLVPERVVSVERGELVLLGEQGRRRAVLAGRLHEDDPPCVGDFVLALSTAPGELTRVVHVFERSSWFRRKAAGSSARPQAIAANVDLAIVVSALPPEGSDPHAYHHGVNSRRIERYLSAAAKAPARAVVALSKADLRAAEAPAIATELARSLASVPVIPVSAKTGSGLAELAAEIAASGTAVLVGSSGVGKSSLTNRLLDHALQRVAEVRESDTRGRHTTTRRELFVLPSGGVLIDSPGMRELGLAADDHSDRSATGTGFAEIDSLSGACRFRDCHHLDEPGCAVLAAVARGEIETERLEHAHKLARELTWQKVRQAELERRADRKRSRRQRREPDLE